MANRFATWQENGEDAAARYWKTIKFACSAVAAAAAAATASVKCGRIGRCYPTAYRGV